MMKPLLITTGEPAGIGPDICIEAAMALENLVFVGDKEELRKRAKLLNIELEILNYQPNIPSKPGQLMVYDIPCAQEVIPGQLNPENAQAVIEMLEWACRQVLDGQFSGLVTAPVHKAQLQHARPDFLGHTEFFQKICKSPQVVMMLADERFRVALVTTHLPIKKVADAINLKKITTIVETIHHGLKNDFGINNPRIAIAGLNPHAGEDGALGDEEIKIIRPAILQLQKQGIQIKGPFSADTMFIKEDYDVYIAMYHDQGLAVLKYATFGKAANISLGLPIIRTSVDHGTALELAGSGNAKADSLFTAIAVAKNMVLHRGQIK